MARIHTDLHFIPADKVPLALQLLIDYNVITRSEKDVRFCDLARVKRSYPDSRAIIEVQSIY